MLTTTLYFIVCCNIEEGILRLLLYLKQIAACKIKGMIYNLSLHCLSLTQKCSTRYIKRKKVTPIHCFYSNMRHESVHVVTLVARSHLRVIAHLPSEP